MSVILDCTVGGGSVQFGCKVVQSAFKPAWVRKNPQRVVFLQHGVLHFCNVCGKVGG